MANKTNLKGKLKLMTVLDLQTNVVFREVAARLERSSFFATGNATGKIAGVEGGKAAIKKDYKSVSTNVK
ncbi:hypothetical protein [Chryseobacterium sp. FH1]|uniref:hypothetical protein n=1 Tax=Chryseobacterium sp. FH1 TaxID=1233951 RepID=UPI0004E30D75|nr:hypothetical protein [Chryseobacterium sp. FH1]KFC24570.1 hypothetical protein IO90_00175 [Chryseobacterium sp. FH1]